MYTRIASNAMGRITLRSTGLSALSTPIIAHRQSATRINQHARQLSSFSNTWSKRPSTGLASIRGASSNFAAIHKLSSVRFSSTFSNQTEAVGVAPLTAPVTPEISIDTTSQVVDPVAADTVVNAANTALHIGDFKAMGLANYTPVGAVEALLEAVQVWTGMPWWLTIPAVTVMVRAAMVPIMAAQQRNTVALHNVSPEMEKIKKKLVRAQQDKDTASVAIHSQEIRVLFEKNNVSPIRTLFLSLSQFPVFISFFLALRNMSAIPVPQMTVGGLAWFENLAVADPTYIFPVLSSLSFLATSELNMHFNPNTAMSSHMKLAIRVLPAAMIVFTASLPVSLHIYWLASSLFSILQIIAFRMPLIRKLLRIPASIEHPKAFIRK